MPCAKSTASSVPSVDPVIKVKFLQMAVDTSGRCVVEEDSTAILRVSPATQNSGSSLSFHDEQLMKENVGFQGVNELVAEADEQ